MVRFLCISVFLICFSSYGQRDLLAASYQQANSCVSPSVANTNTELNITNASAICGDEANSIPPTGGGNGEMLESGVIATSVLDSSSGLGEYVMNLEATAASSARGRFYFVAPNGVNIRVIAKVRMVTGTSGRMRFASGTTSTASVTFSDTAWTEYTLDRTTSSTTVQFEVYAANSGNIGDVVQVKFTIKQL